MWFFLVDNASKWEYDNIIDTLFSPGTLFEGLSITKRGYIRPADRDEVDKLAHTPARGKGRFNCRLHCHKNTSLNLRDAIFYVEIVAVQYDRDQLEDQLMPYSANLAAYYV